MKKKKISGILQETVDKLGVRYLIVGICINLSKNPYIKGYPTTNLNYFVNKKLSKKNLKNKIKIIIENKMSKFYEIK